MHPGTAPDPGSALDPRQIRYRANGMSASSEKGDELPSSRLFIDVRRFRVTSEVR